MSFDRLKNNAESMDGRILNQIRQGEPFIILVQSSQNEQKRFLNSLLPNSDLLLQKLDTLDGGEFDNDWDGNLHELNHNAAPEIHPTLTIHDLLFNTKVQIVGIPGYAPLWSILIGLDQIHLLQQLTIILNNDILIEAINNGLNTQDRRLVKHLNSEAHPAQIDTLLRVLRGEYMCVDLFLETTDGDYFPFDEQTSRRADQIRFGERIEVLEELRGEDGLIEFNYIGLDKYVDQRIQQLGQKPNLKLIEDRLARYIELIPRRDIEGGMVKEIASLIVTLEEGRYTVSYLLSAQLQQLTQYIISELTQANNVIPLNTVSDVGSLIICAEYLVSTEAKESYKNIYWLCYYLAKLGQDNPEVAELMQTIASLWLRVLPYCHPHLKDIEQLNYLYQFVEKHTDVANVYNSEFLNDLPVMIGFTSLLAIIINNILGQHKIIDHKALEPYHRLLSLIYYHKQTIRDYHPEAVFTLIWANLRRSINQADTQEMIEFYIVNFEDHNINATLIAYRYIFEFYMTSEVSSINMFRNNYIAFLNRHPEITEEKFKKLLADANHVFNVLNSMQ